MLYCSYRPQSHTSWQIYSDRYLLMCSTDCISHCIVRNDDGEWCVGEVMTHPLNGYELKLQEKMRQSTSKLH